MDDRIEDIISRSVAVLYTVFISHTAIANLSSAWGSELQCTRKVCGCRGDWLGRRPNVFPPRWDMTFERFEII